jgi:hypothetical protein
VTRVYLFSMARDDQQGVVDAHAETDHDADERSEVGDLEHMAQQDDERATEADAEQRHADRQTHREHRPEGNDEDDDGEREAEELGRRLFELCEEEATELDSHALDVGDLIANLVGDLRRAREVDVLGQVHRGVGDPTGRITAIGDLELAARVVWTLHRGDVVDLCDRGEELLHRGAHRGVVDTLLGLEHDLGLLRRAAPVGELGLHDGEAFGRLEAVE